MGITLGGTGRNLMLLMAGAALTGALGILAVQWIRILPDSRKTLLLELYLAYFSVLELLLSHIQTLQGGSGWSE